MVITPALPLSVQLLLSFVGLLMGITVVIVGRLKDAPLGLGRYGPVEPDVTQTLT